MNKTFFALMISVLSFFSTASQAQEFTSRGDSCGNLSLQVLEGYVKVRGKEHPVIPSSTLLSCHETDVRVSYRGPNSFVTFDLMYHLERTTRGVVAVTSDTGSYYEVPRVPNTSVCTWLTDSNMNVHVCFNPITTEL